MSINLEMSFNPNDHLMQLKSKEGSKDYLPVQWRLVWFRKLCPEGTIDTEELAYDVDREVEVEAYVWNKEKNRSEKTMKKAKGYARYRAVVTDGRGGRATGTKSENAASFPDFGEKAETGAIGRALAALGYGTQFTGDEFEEAHRIVDSPVERGNSPDPGAQQSLPQSTNGQKTALQRAVDAAMQRALVGKVIANEAEFSGLLDKIGVPTPKTGQDINKINAAISEMVAAVK